jgi:hypothetical protein
VALFSCGMSETWLGTRLYVDGGVVGGLAPKIDNKTMCWRENKQLSAAPASRRLGRAGLEAPPLRGRKILSF